MTAPPESSRRSLEYAICHGVAPLSSQRDWDPSQFLNTDSILGSGGSIIFILCASNMAESEGDQERHSTTMLEYQLYSLGFALILFNVSRSED
jgi:hypothetical protein